MVTCVREADGLEHQVDSIKHNKWAAQVAQQFSAAFIPGPDPGDQGSSPTSSSLHGACFSLCLCTL